MSEQNCITEIARRDGRDYVTPEDVGEALKTDSVEIVRRDVLQVLGKQAGFGAEDASLCAFIAWNGKNI